jgi:hypothetical protein
MNYLTTRYAKPKQSDLKRLIDISKREQDRLGEITSWPCPHRPLTLPDLQHHLFLLTLDGELYNAPLKDLSGGLHNVLDIGTGTGIWAIDFGKLCIHTLFRNMLTSQSLLIPLSQCNWDRPESHSTRPVRIFNCHPHSQSS